MMKQCDEQQHGCGQCVKRKETCPGYRNIVDLMFRDESDHVIEKAKKTRRKSGSRRLVAESDAMTDGSSTSSPAPAPPGPTPPPYRVVQSRAKSNSSSSPEATNIRWDTGWEEDVIDDHHGNENVLPTTATTFDSQTTYQEQGIAFFFSQYVTADKGSFPNYDFIYDVWQPPIATDEKNPDPITPGIIAVGLAGLSKLTGCKKAMLQARQSYGIALQRTNAALQDSTEVVKDTSMLSVLLLGTYEFMSGTTPQTIQSWQKHVNGAAAVASIRGTAQFRTNAGVRMFLLLTHSVLLSCMQTGLPMPKPILQLREDLEKLDILNKATLRIVGHLSKTIQLRYDIKTGVLSKQDHLLTKLFDIETEFLSIVSALPSPIRYRIVQLEQPHVAAFGHTCHVYPGLTHVTTWNAIRTMRILVQESIIEQLCDGVDDPLTLDDTSKRRLQHAIHIQQKLSLAIVASVPQHFGVVNWVEAVNGGCPEAADPEKKPNQDDSQQTRDPTNPQSSSAPANVSIQLPSLMDTANTSGPGGHNAARFMLLATSSNTIVWPLHTVGMSLTCSTELRTYIVERLDAIYSETGFHQAHEVANMVRKKKTQSDKWIATLSSLSSLSLDCQLPEIV